MLSRRFLGTVKIGPVDTRTGGSAMNRISTKKHEDALETLHDLTHVDKWQPQPIPRDQESNRAKSPGLGFES